MKKNLTKIRLYKKDFSLEFIICIAFSIGLITLLLLPDCMKQSVEEFLYHIITPDRISLITNISAIFIGIYTNVLIVIATSKLSITELLLEKKLDQRILIIIGIGIIEDFLIIVMAFFSSKNCIYLMGYLWIVFIALIAFIKFIITVFKIFKINIDKMIKEIDKDNKDKTNLIIQIEEELYILKKLDKHFENKKEE